MNISVDFYNITMLPGPSYYYRENLFENVKYQIVKIDVHSQWKIFPCYVNAFKTSYIINLKKGKNTNE